MSDARSVVDQQSGRIGTFTSILVVAIVGNTFIALTPLFVGGMADYWGFEEGLIGELISIEFFGVSLATVLGIFFLHRSGWPIRATAFTAIAIFAIGNLITPSIYEQENLLKFTRFVCGCATGITWLAAATALVQYKNADRAVALLYGSPFFMGMILQPLMPSIFAGWGFSSVFYLMSIGCILGFLVFPFFPKRNIQNTTEDQAQSSNVLSSLVLLSLIVVALFLQYVANTGLWTYFERIGVLAGHDKQTVANVVGWGAGMALVGTALAVFYATRIKPLNAILFGTAIITIASLLILFSNFISIYLLALSLFNAMITFVTPFYFILIIKIYNPAKAVIIGNICMIVGFSLGPVFIGYTAGEDSFTQSIYATAILFLISGLIMVLYSKVIGKFKY